MNNVIEVCNVVKSYGKELVLNNISFNLCCGEILGLLGPSGCGKTTVIKTILSITDIDSGYIKILGKENLRLNTLRDLGYMAQESALYDYLTGYQHLKFFGELYDIKGEDLEGKIEYLSSLLELKDALNKKVMKYSGGMKKRLAFAIALIHEPKILILDEPTVGIDPILRRQIWVELRKLADSGVSIIITTHVMDEVANCDKLILIRDGIILANNAPAKILEESGETSIESAFIHYIGGSDNESIHSL